MSRALRHALLLALGPLAAGACDGDQDPRDALAHEIEINRAVWEAQRPGRYTFVLERQCFCGVEARGPVALEVEGGVVLSRVYVDGGEPVAPTFHETFPAVSGLFDILAEAVATGADEMEVTWDPATGVPTRFFIDYQVGVADEEEGYLIRQPPEAVSGQRVGRS